MGDFAQAKGNDMIQGTIEKIITERGFGFIRASDGRQIFFHRSALSAGEVFDNLRVGLAVEFDVQADAKGPRAAKLTVVQDPRA
jgi:CspA family cold shock protein